MRPSAGSSRTLLAACGLLALWTALATAKVYLTADEAARLAFPGATVARQVVYLTDAEISKVQDVVGAKMESAMVTRFSAWKEGAPAGTAYINTHRVRTLSETLLVVLAVDGTIRRIEVLSFSEPEEYLPRATWFEQFAGRGLDAELSLKAGIRPVAGATLTARAVTGAARRVLAVNRVLSERTRP